MAKSKTKWRYLEKHPENATSNNNTLTMTKDQLWFDTWEGQIELSSQDLSPKKHHSAISDLLLEDEVDQFDEFADLSTFERKHSSSSAFLRQTTLPTAIFSSKFDTKILSGWRKSSLIHLIPDICHNASSRIPLFY